MGGRGFAGAPGFPRGPLAPPGRPRKFAVSPGRYALASWLRRNPDADELEVDASLHIEPGDELKVLESSDDGMWRNVCRSW